MPLRRSCSVKAAPPGAVRSGRRWPVDRELGADLDAGREVRPAGDAHEEPGAASRPAATPTSADAPKGLGRGIERRWTRRCLDMAGSHLRERCVQRSQPRFSDCGTHEDQRNRQHAEVVSLIRNRGCQRRRPPRAHGGRGGGGEQSEDEASDGHLERRRVWRSSRLQRVAQRGQALLADAVDLRSSSIEPKPPWASRYSTIRSASVGPMPSTSSSCSAVAVERWICAPGVAAAPSGAEPAADPPFTGTTICWPSWTFAARFTSVRSARRVGPPARSSADATRVSGGTRIRPGRRTAPATCTYSSAPPAEPPAPRRPMRRAARGVAHTGLTAPRTADAHRRRARVTAAEQTHPGEDGQRGRHRPDHDRRARFPAPPADRRKDARHGRATSVTIDVTRSADLEPRQALGLLGALVDRFDVRAAAGPASTSRTIALTAPGSPSNTASTAPSRRFVHPAGHSARARLAPAAVPEEHALDAAAHHDSAPDLLTHTNRARIGGIRGNCHRLGRGFGVWTPARRPALPARQLPLAAGERHLARHARERAQLQQGGRAAPARRDGERVRGGRRDASTASSPTPPSPTRCSRATRASTCRRARSSPSATSGGGAASTRR